MDEFSLSLRTTDGLNETTRRAEISAGSPVFRLRPRRSLFWRTVNTPSPESFAASPRAKQSVIWSNTCSTSALHSCGNRPTSRRTASYKSSRVTAFLAILDPSPALTSKPTVFPVCVGNQRVRFVRWISACANMLRMLLGANGRPCSLRYPAAASSRDISRSERWPPLGRLRRSCRASATISD